MDGEEGTTSEVSKSPKYATPPADTKWEWKNDGGWIAFDAEHSRVIAKAFKQKKQEVVIQVSFPVL